MRKLWLIGTAAVLLLAACGPAADTTPAPTEAAIQPTDAPTDTPAPTAAPTHVPPDTPFQPDALVAQRGEYFGGSGGCVACHNAMTDESGAAVSPNDHWPSTMMANAARDPYWQATVRREVIDHPDYPVSVEATCANCHMPMAHFTQAADGEDTTILDEGGLLSRRNPLHGLAMDAVSCTLCHQIEAEGFGAPESFSGGFVIDAETPAGERVSYGPYEADNAQIRVMQTASGFIPVQSDHIHESDLCATCHTLITPYQDENGEIAGMFPEQTPYLEWRHSSFAQTDSCQDCHMPEASGGVVLSTTGGEPRQPFNQHHFVGGNYYIPAVLSAFGAELPLTASADQFAATVDLVLDQLSEETAAVELGDPVRDGETLTLPVTVTNLTGHKFPTAFPSRRAWLHVTVTAADGSVVFESGAYTEQGAIVGAASDEDPTLFEPHHDVIANPDDVQIYESIMRTIDGHVTTDLLGAESYVKDNRLLPDGFDAATAAPEIAVHGGALEDDTFIDGSDTVLYTVAVGAAEGPFAVTVELLYQPISYRWAMDLTAYDTAESAAFAHYVDAVPVLPALVAEAETEVE